MTRYMLGVYNGNDASGGLADLAEDPIVYVTLAEAMEGLRLTVDEYTIGFTGHNVGGNEVEPVGDAAVRLRPLAQDLCPIYAQVTPVEDDDAAWGGIDHMHSDWLQAAECAAGASYSGGDMILYFSSSHVPWSVYRPDAPYWRDYDPAHVTQVGVESVQSTSEPPCEPWS